MHDTTYKWNYLRVIRKRFLFYYEKGVLMFEVGDLIEYNAYSFASPDMRTWTGIIVEKEKNKHCIQ